MMKLLRLCFAVCVTVYTCAVGVHSLTEQKLHCTDDFTLQSNFTVNRDSTIIKKIFIRNSTTDLCQSHCLNYTEECTGFLSTEETFGCTLIIGRFRQLSSVDSSSNFSTRSCDFEQTFYVNFYIQPKTVIELGHPVDLVCDVYGAPDAIVSIKFKDQELSTKQIYTINNASKMDDGQYFCSVKRNQSDHDPIVKTFQLMIRYAPEFVNGTGNDDQPLARNTTSLTCTFRGLPKEVTWSKAGHVLNYPSIMVFHANGLLSDTIQIDSVDSEIYGQYKCDGKNKYGHIEGLVNLKNKNCLGADDDIHGSCLYGCVQGRYGAKCEKECPDDCLVCHPYLGFCLLYDCNHTVCNTTHFTNTSCTQGKYGNDCRKTCMASCERSTTPHDYVCEKFTGACVKPCRKSYYGSHCNIQCGPCTFSNGTITSCNRLTGICADTTSSSIGLVSSIIVRMVTGTILALVFFVL